MDYYLIKEFFYKLVFVTLAFIIIFIVVDIIDHLDKFIDSSMPAIDIIKYYIYTIPWFASIGLPMAILLSTILTISILQKNSELTALKASGISFKRITSSLLILGLILSIFSFIFDNYVVTSNYQKRVIIEDSYKLKKRNENKTKKRNIYRQLDKNTVLSIKYFQFDSKIAHGVSIQKFSDQKLYYRIDSPRMQWNDSLSYWILTNYKVRDWTEDNIKYFSGKTDSILNIDLSPIDITRETVKPEEMDYWTLLDFVSKLKKNGINEPRWEVNLHFKTALAGTSFLMVLFGLSLSIRKPRSSLALGVGLGISTIFIYYSTIKFGQTLGYKGQIEPFLSVWGPNIIFLIIGIVLFKRTKT